MTISPLASMLGSLSESPKAENEASIRDAAKQFEALLLKQMFRELRSSSLGDSASNASKAYREIADEQMAEHLANSGAFGFGKVMAEQMLAQIRASSLTVKR